MHKMTRIETRTLNWINRIRKEFLKMKPLKRIKRGIVADGLNCPVARSLPGVDTPATDPGDSILHTIDRLPGYAHNFIDRFDAGKLPQYISKK